MSKTYDLSQDKYNVKYQLVGTDQIRTVKQMYLYSLTSNKADKEFRTPQEILQQVKELVAKGALVKIK